MDVPETSDKRVSRRGFASMDPDRRKEIARLGGARVPAELRSFSQDKDLAREAGRKGGLRKRHFGEGETNV